MPSSSSFNHQHASPRQECYAASGVVILLNFAIRRDFRRAALLGWITPLPATRSNTLTAAITALLAASSSPPRIASSAFFTKDRAIDRYGRFRARFRSAMRIRLRADLLLAKEIHPSFTGYTCSDIRGRPPGSPKAPREWYQCRFVSSSAERYPR